MSFFKNLEQTPVIEQLNFLSTLRFWQFAVSFLQIKVMVCVKAAIDPVRLFTITKTFGETYRAMLINREHYIWSC